MNYKEGGVAMGEEKQSSGFGFEASEVPELERKEFITKVRLVAALMHLGISEHAFEG